MWRPRAADEPVTPHTHGLKMQRSLLQSATDAICTCVWGLSGCGYETPEYTYIDSNDSRKWIAIAYATCVFVAFAFAAYAVLRWESIAVVSARLRSRRRARRHMRVRQ